MPDGKHDLVDLRDGHSPDGPHDISELLARFASLEKELGAFHPRNEFQRSARRR
jgi:hypothetical protein